MLTYMCVCGSITHAVPVFSPQLLGELYPDKEYLDKLLKDPGQTYLDILNSLCAFNIRITVEPLYCGHHWAKKMHPD